MKKLFALLLITGLLSIAAPAQAHHGGKHVFVTINGLVCDFCARSMEKTFSKKNSVADVQVDLTTKIVTIGLKSDAVLGDDEIRTGVVDAGYDVVGIKRD